MLSLQSLCYVVSHVIDLTIGVVRFPQSLEEFFATFDDGIIRVIQVIAHFLSDLHDDMTLSMMDWYNNQSKIVSNQW
jgi:hypothetical protein